jgi:hypothetical protein
LTIGEFRQPALPHYDKPAVASVSLIDLFAILGAASDLQAAQSRVHAANRGVGASFALHGRGRPVRPFCMATKRRLVTKI